MSLFVTGHSGGVINSCFGFRSETRCTLVSSVACPFSYRTFLTRDLFSLFSIVPQLKLDENQLSEQQALRTKLQQEQEMLSAYQDKQFKQLRAQHEREEKDLQDKVSVRRALLEEKVHYFQKKIFCNTNVQSNHR